jgi:hypothetical protein
MIRVESFSLEHIQQFRRDSSIDASILERSIFALALVEALVRVGLPFIFKGGTSLLLLLEQPRRLSTDIDIIVEPDTDVWAYLDEAAKIYPFKEMEEHIRKGKNNIEKRHIKFTYDSPVQEKPFYILLDILYEENHYTTLVKKEIRHEFLQTEEPYVKVTMPSINCILGDKMTAFAPHTTGILITEEKELEIIKQLYDVAALIDAFDSFKDTYNTYMSTVSTELAYRGLTISAQEVLRDTLDAASCIAGRGKLINEDYSYYLKGMRGIMNHIFGERFT